jgi:DNA-binding GntR family transcriptional regulator
MTRTNAESAFAIDRRSIEARVADALRERFLAGDFQPGERLTEERLARELAVSRGPIRAALQRLEREQLVVLKPYCGWEVARPTEQDAWELATLRCGLEELGCRLAAAAMTQASAARLREAQQRLIAIGNSGRRAALTDADYALHDLIMELSGNRRLHESYVQLRQQIRFLIAAVNVPFRARNIAHSHDAMIDALCAGDGEAAAVACREHLAVMIANSKAN